MLTISSLNLPLSSSSTTSRTCTTTLKQHWVKAPCLCMVYRRCYDDDNRRLAKLNNNHNGHRNHIKLRQNKFKHVIKYKHNCHF